MSVELDIYRTTMPSYGQNGSDIPFAGFARNCAEWNCKLYVYLFVY